LPKDDSRGTSTDTLSTSSGGQAFAEELKMQERARQVEEFKKERDQYNKLIEKGDQLLQANDIAAALKAFTEAAELSPYEIYPKLKLNQIRKNVDQAAIGDDELYRQYMLKGQIAEKERKYEEAKEDYTVALLKSLWKHLFLKKPFVG
jgi:tetratricopeptide (TPR) repeat protein